MREKVEKSRLTVFFTMICGPGGSRSRLAKAAGVEPSGEMRDEKLHAAGAPRTFRSQNGKSTSLSVLLEVELLKKLRSVVARSTCPSQNEQSTPGSDHTWKLKCSTSVVA